MNLKKFIVLILLFPATVWGQRDELELNDFLSIVLKNHPIAKQYEYRIQSTKWQITSAKGQFDPKLNSRFYQKQFNDKEYFSLWNNSVDLHTRSPFGVYGGFDQSSGQYLNNQEFLPDGGLIYGGVSVAVGKGMFIDERRAALQIAKESVELTINEQEQLINELKFNATKTYIDWVFNFNRLEIVREMRSIAKERFDLLKILVDIGERPGIDTVEAKIQLQLRDIDLNEATNDIRNTRLKLSVFLWTESMEPAELLETVVPNFELEEIELNQITADSLKNNLTNLFNTNPYLRSFQNKLSILEIEQRWKKEQLKPTFNIRYNLLNEPVGNFNDRWSTNNYTFGADFSFPLFLRKERAEMKINLLKISDINAEYSYKKISFENYLNQIYNDYTILNEQYVLINDIYENYRLLTEAEKLKFSSGESSLFMINARENSLIEAQTKRLKFLADIQKNIALWNFITGS
ncbi:MAG: TolC family protein [Flavobacteriales bacterium]